MAVVETCAGEPHELCAPLADRGFARMFARAGAPTWVFVPVARSLWPPASDPALAKASDPALGKGSAPAFARGSGQCARRCTGRAALATETGIVPTDGVLARRLRLAPPSA